ncbi:MAG: hypothetical protein LBJ59_03065 [Zoogloeaceae bacterium]|jgi:hypothetical protein|nr:hypothetical protein [Zoogloeaceae bacterium]
MKDLSEALPPSERSIDHFELGGHEFIFTMEGTDMPLPSGIRMQNNVETKKSSVINSMIRQLRGFPCRNSMTSKHSTVRPSVIFWPCTITKI